MVAVNRRVPAAAARAHTRKGKSDKRSPAFSRGILRKLSIVSIVGFLAWAYKVIQPPASAICGSPNGPPVTAPRIRLQDGRHLACKEFGLPRKRAKYKIIMSHGYQGSRNDTLQASEEFMEELGACIVTFDRPGYGESDPHPKRSVKSAAFDIEELADQLDLGPKFYVMGFSLGGHAIWGCLKYIPHRLAGVALLAPVINYRWPGFPANLSEEVYYQRGRQYQWALRVCYYTPWLTYWWMTQKWSPIPGTWKPLNRHDQEIVLKLAATGRSAEYLKAALQQGIFESLHRDIMVMFGKWDFDPLELNNPFPNHDVPAHIWQGDEDALVPVTLQRYIGEKISWIHYHEFPGVGHLFPLMDDIPDRILKCLLLGEEC